MSSENDVPLGDGSRRYYEQKFGDRIRQVSKSGGKDTNSGGSKWNGRAGIGGVIFIIFIVLRLVAVIGRNDRPPVQQQGDFNEIQRQMDQTRLQNQADKIRFRNGIHERTLKQLLETPSFREEDVPLLTGLCYRIDRERRRLKPTPGGQIYKLLDESSRKLLVKSAERDNLDVGERALLIAGLNKVLDREDFYDEAAFLDMPDIVNLRLNNKLHLNNPDAFPLNARSANRRLLEKCYPEQIVPYLERASLKEKQVEWFTRAHLDLLEAREQIEDANH
jgi:hypothetical protein